MPGAARLRAANAKCLLHALSRKCVMHHTTCLIRGLARWYDITCLTVHYLVAAEPRSATYVLNRRNWCRSVGAVQRPLNNAPTPRVGGKQAGSQTFFVFVPQSLRCAFWKRCELAAVYAELAANGPFPLLPRCSAVLWGGMPIRAACAVPLALRASIDVLSLMLGGGTAVGI